MVSVFLDFGGMVSLNVWVYSTASYYTTGQPIFNRHQGGAAARIGGFRALQQMSRFGLLGADTVGAENALVSPIGNPGNCFSAWVQHASEAPEHWSVEALVGVVLARSRT